MPVVGKYPSTQPHTQRGPTGVPAEFCIKRSDRRGVEALDLGGIVYDSFDYVAFIVWCAMIYCVIRYLCSGPPGDRSPRPAPTWQRRRASRTRTPRASRTLRRREGVTR